MAQLAGQGLDNEGVGDAGVLFGTQGRVSVKGRWHPYIMPRRRNPTQVFRLPSALTVDRCAVHAGDTTDARGRSTQQGTARTSEAGGWGTRLGG